MPINRWPRFDWSRPVTERRHLKFETVFPLTGSLSRIKPAVLRQRVLSRFQPI